MNRLEQNIGYNPYEHCGNDFNSIVVSKPKQTDVYSETPFFSFEGRIGRIQAFAYFCIFNILLLILENISLASIGEIKSSDDLMYLFSKVFLLEAVIFIASFIYFLSIVIRRLHDLDYSGWWVVCFIFFLLIGVPGNNGWLFFKICAIVIFTYLSIMPGSKKVNRFGYPPEPPGLVSKLMALVMFLSLLIVFI